MTPAPLTYAERARAAHRALRLTENGIRSEKQIRQLAGTARPLMATPPEGEDQHVGDSALHPLARTAFALYAYTDPDITDFPTDPGFVEELMNMGDLDSIWKVWDESVTANLEETMDMKALKAWRASVEKDAKTYAEAVAVLAETGDVTMIHPIFGHGRANQGAANTMYDLGREGFADGTIIWTATPTHKVYLVDSADYAFSISHQFVSSVASAGRVAVTAALTTKTKALGVCDADDTVFTGVSGDQSEAMVVAQTSAIGGGADVADTSQRLIGYIDTATGLPVTPNTGNINVTWDNGSNRIFKL